jgi:nucleotide-binding universal stress UspA family protein
MEEEREGMAALNTVKGIFDEVAVHVETDLRQGIPAEAIPEIARKGRYELIVIGRKGRGGVRELLLGSVSKTVLRNAPCSILVGR